MKLFTPLFLMLLCLLLCSSDVLAQCECSEANCDYYIEPGMPNYAFYADELKEEMGVTDLSGKRICIKAGNYSSRILFWYVEGSPGAPVTIKNCGGQAVVDGGTQSAILLWDSKYISLLGNACAGEPENLKYGIRAKSATNYVEAKAVRGRITDIEMAFLDIGADNGTVGAAGIKIIDEPGCDEDTIAYRDDPRRKTISNILIHDNYIHNVGLEGTYIGKGGWYFGGTGKCSFDPSIKSYAVSLKNVRIYNNIIENTGWDGLQLKDADENVKVYNNRISHYGVVNNGGQNEGMVLGSGVVADVYNNSIINGSGWGFHYTGLGYLNFYNNIVANSGQSGLFINGTEVEEPQPNGYIRILNNTIVKTGTNGVSIGKYDYVTDRILMNNIIAEVNPSYPPVTWGFTEKSNNLENRDATELKFAQYAENSAADFLTNDYHLTMGSPAIDFGKNVSAYNVTDDFDGKPRNHNGSYDVGAYEYDGVTTPGDNDNSKPWELYINAGGYEFSEPIVDSDPRIWEQDRNHPTLDAYYKSYGTGSTSAFAGTNTTGAPKQILGTYRFTNATGAIIQYKIPVPVSGATYDIEVFFARKSSDTYTSGYRRFNIIAEGVTHTTWDVYDKGGSDGKAASAYAFASEVRDGLLELKFVPVPGAYAQVNAIAIRKRPVSTEPNTEVPTTPSASLFINSGGTEIEDNNFNTWENDKPHATLDTSVKTYETGSPSAFAGPNLTMAPDKVLGTNRNTINASAQIRYNIPVTEAGDYEIEMFFARKKGETWTSGARRFNIVIEGQLVTTYDIFDKGGTQGNAASSLTHTATVTDGDLEVAFVPVAGSRAQVNALRVEGQLGDLSAARMSTTAVEEEAVAVNVYPNPVTDYVDLTFSADDTYHVRIITAHDEVYLDQVIAASASETTRLDVSGLTSKQMFVVNVQSSGGMKSFKMFKR